MGRVGTAGLRQPRCRRPLTGSLAKLPEKPGDLDHLAAARGAGADERAPIPMARLEVRHVTPEQVVQAHAPLPLCSRRRAKAWALPPSLQPHMDGLLRLADSTVRSRRCGTPRPEREGSDPPGRGPVLQTLQEVGTGRPAYRAMFEPEPSVDGVHLAGRDEVSRRPLPAPFRGGARRPSGAAVRGRRALLRRRVVARRDTGATLVHPVVGGRGDRSLVRAAIGVAAAGQRAGPGRQSVAEHAVGAAERSLLSCHEDHPSQQAGARESLSVTGCLRTDQVMIPIWIAPVRLQGVTPSSSDPPHPPEQLLIDQLPVEDRYVACIF